MATRSTVAYGESVTESKYLDEAVALSHEITQTVAHLEQLRRDRDVRIARAVIKDHVRVQDAADALDLSVSGVRAIIAPYRLVMTGILPDL
jgi:hypothetical protein